MFLLWNHTASGKFNLEICPYFPKTSLSVLMFNTAAYITCLATWLFFSLKHYILNIACIWILRYTIQISYLLQMNTPSLYDTRTLKLSAGNEFCLKFAHWLTRTICLYFMVWFSEIYTANSIVLWFFWFSHKQANKNQNSTAKYII